MTFDNMLDLTSTALLGGGATVIAVIIGAFLTIRKVKNGKLITGYMIAGLTTLAKMLKDRKDTIAELHDVSELVVILRDFIDGLTEPPKDDTKSESEKTITHEDETDA